MLNRKFKALGAVALSAVLALGVWAGAGSVSGRVYAQEEEEQGQVTLALAENDEEETGAKDADVADETEVVTEEATEEATEAPVVYETLETTKTDEAAASAIDVSDIVENTIPSIVAITTTSVQAVESYFYGRQEFEIEGGGSGIIIAQNDSELIIATNNHVVDDATDLTVCFTVDVDDEDPDRLLAPAVVKGTSARNDLAVIAVNMADIDSEVLPKLKIATLGSSKDLKVGEPSIVIGNALGIGQTVTTGIISALEREITTEIGVFTELQTDAAINFGCSGGAILNKKGEVIGIVSAKSTYNDAESMGYGIPIDTAVPILKDLINRQTREEVDKHGFLGITVVPVSDEAMTMYNMPAGAFVYEVSDDSAAYEAGIRKGDIITKFDGVDVDSSDSLVELIGYYEVGETVKVEVQTAENGAYTAHELEVTLQEGAVEDTEEEGNEDGSADEDADKDADKEMIDPLPYGDDGQDLEDWGFGNGGDYFGNGGDSFGMDDYFGQFFFGDGFQGYGDRPNDGGSF